jgi:hypothetical protein
VKDLDEWLIVLLGTKKEKGLHVIVDDIYVPLRQHREYAHCSIPDDDPLPSWLLSEAVGALHSHHSMAAKFSSGDKAEDGLCSTFSSSIVIGSNIGPRDEEAILLGFEYEAEVTYELPCGALGISPAKIVPLGIDDWPFLWEIETIEITKGNQVKLLGDCSEYGETEDSTRYEYRRMGKCGLVETESNLRTKVFGSNGEPILSSLPKPFVRSATKSKGKGASHIIDDSYGYYTVEYDEEAELLDKYLEYAKYSEEGK